MSPDYRRQWAAATEQANSGTMPRNNARARIPRVVITEPTAAGPAAPAAPEAPTAATGEIAPKPTKRQPTRSPSPSVNLHRPKARGNNTRSNGLSHMNWGIHGGVQLHNSPQNYEEGRKQPRKENETPAPEEEEDEPRED